MVEFVDSGLYFVQDENNFINPLLQVGSGSGSSEKKYRIRRAKNQRIRILIPVWGGDDMIHLHNIYTCLTAILTWNCF